MTKKTGPKEPDDQGADLEEIHKAVVYSLSKAGDFSLLTDDERSAHYSSICSKLGLNALTKPMDYMRLNGKLVLYMNRGGTDQLAAIHKIKRRLTDGPKEIQIAGTKMIFAACEAELPDGRTEVSVATVPLNDPINVLMRAETKAKRRATLAILGLGLLDEMEVQDIDPAAKERPSSSKEQPAPQTHPAQVEKAPVPASRQSSSSSPAPEVSETRDIELDADYEGVLRRKLDEVVMVACSMDCSVTERMESIADGIAGVFAEERSKHDRGMNLAIWRFIERYAEKSRCLPRVKEIVKASSQPSAPKSSPAAETAAEAAAEAPAAAPRAAPSPVAEETASPARAEPDSSVDRAAAPPIATGAQGADPVELNAIVDAVRATPPSTSAFAGVWCTLGSILDSNLKTRGYEMFLAEVKKALPSVSVDEMLAEIRKNKADPKEEAKARHFSASTDGPLWNLYLETLETEGHVAGAFGKRAETFRKLASAQARERFDVAVQRMMAITGKDQAFCRTRLQDIVKHNENAKESSAKESSASA